MFIRKSVISKTITQTIKASILLIASLSSLPTLGAEEGDSVGKSLNLHEITITSEGPRKILRTDSSDGSIIIDGKTMGEQSSSFSSPDH